jgi:hypothetical protein
MLDTWYGLTSARPLVGATTTISVFSVFCDVPAN